MEHHCASCDLADGPCQCNFLETTASLPGMLNGLVLTYLAIAGHSTAGRPAEECLDLPDWLKHRQEGHDQDPRLLIFLISSICQIS